MKKAMAMCVVLLLSTGLFTSCGKQNAVKTNRAESSTNTTEQFAEEFFYQSNLPYEKLELNDIPNGAEEYLFYIPNGVVYRTLYDYAVVIVDRKDIQEAEERRNTDYSGELYQVFEEDEIDLLKYSAAGDYAIMTNPGTIPDWEDDEVITAFMEFAPNCPSK